MIVSFFGHSNFSPKKSDMERLLEVLENQIQGQDVEFFVGDYGNFDYFSYEVAREYQKKHSNSKVVFVTAYLNSQRHTEYAKKCDESIYPDIEKVPLRFAIIERNKWVVKKSDFIVFYFVVAGGTSNTYYYAKQMGKNFYNLCSR